MSDQHRQSTPLPANTKVLARELKPVLDALEKGRLQSLQRMSTGWRKIGLCVLLMIAVSLLAIMIGSQFSPRAIENTGILIIPVVIAGIIYCVCIYSKYISGHQAIYKDLYKRKVIGGITRLIQPDMTYSPERGISEQTFRETGLYSSSIDRYSCEDLFAGKIGKTAMMFSEIHAEEKKQRTDSKGKTTTYWETIFKGLLVIADFNKNFKSWVTVKPDFAESAFGWLGRTIQNFSANLVRLESPEFEKAFVVHGCDQVEARYILTPDLQERLLDLRKWFGDDIRMAFHQSRLHLTIPNSDNWFEPHIKTSANDPAQMRQFLHQMSSIFRMVEILDLNTRIWTKD